MDRSTAARIAAHHLHATVDSKAHTLPARNALHRKFELQVDPDGVLPPEELARRVKHAKSEHYLRLAQKSAESRARAAAGKSAR